MSQAPHVSRPLLPRLLAALSFSVVLASPAAAQWFGSNPAPYGYNRPGPFGSPRPLPPFEIRERLETAGYDPVGPLRYDGSVYEVDALAPSGRRVRLVVDAFRGVLVRQAPLSSGRPDVFDWLDGPGRFDGERSRRSAGRAGPSPLDEMPEGGLEEQRRVPDRRGARLPDALGPDQDGVRRSLPPPAPRNRQRDEARRAEPPVSNSPRDELAGPDRPEFDMDDDGLTSERDIATSRERTNRRAVTPDERQRQDTARIDPPAPVETRPLDPTPSAPAAIPAPTVPSDVRAAPVPSGPSRTAPRGDTAAVAPTRPVPLPQPKTSPTPPVTGGAAAARPEVDEAVRTPPRSTVRVIDGVTPMNQGPRPELSGEAQLQKLPIPPAARTPTVPN